MQRQSYLSLCSKSKLHSVVVAVEDHDGSLLQYSLIGQLGSLAMSRQESETSEYVRIVVPAMANINSPDVGVGIVRELELRLDWVIVSGSDVF